MNRIQEIEQEILELAQNQAQNFSGISGEWGRKVILEWKNSDSSHRLATIKEILNTGYHHGGRGYYFESRIDTQLIQLLNEWGEILIQKLEQELTTERESTQQALQTSQEWHERQKGEIIAEWSNKYQTLIQKWKTSLTQEITLLKEVLEIPEEEDDLFA